ncbi:hypothetical protein AMQ68_18095 [Chryseobacterium sp. ERMR1:04]|nr:hypothetical protein AMQ68_18095 [Chryseobacterium sp. ERMR1:04]
MHYTCPVCNTENPRDFMYSIEEYVCKSCSYLIDVEKSFSKKLVKKPIENVVLEIGQKGILDNTEYTVDAIVVRKYGIEIYWREYYLKDKKGDDAFLSESDGHWVLLYPVHTEDVKKKSSKIAELHTRNYRWYETTECSIHAAEGFFEEKLNFNLATYKEYVNGTNMISQEQSGSKNQYFAGKHISKHLVKKSFKLSHMPNYSGIGIVQPYYIDIKQAINILGIAGLFICLLQLYVYTSRTNTSVFQDTIKFEDVKNKEMVSKSFTLSGGSAPLKVSAHSEVDNSWANLQLSLVNESTNETVYTSKDIEQYHGYEDGENWSEGKTTEEFNLCGIAPGKYHFVISAEKQYAVGTSTSSHFVPSNEGVTISREASGIVDVVNNSTKESVAFGDIRTLEKDSSEIGKLVKQTFPNQNLDSLLTVNSVLESPPANKVSDDSTINIKATWLPVSFWNFTIILILMLAFFIICYWGRNVFNVSKWSNSSNSPYSKS